MKCWKETIEQLEYVLTLTCANSESLIPVVQIGILGSLILALQYARLKNNKGTVTSKSTVVHYDDSFVLFCQCSEKIPVLH